MSSTEQEAYAQASKELQQGDGKKPAFDFNFITQALGLVPINEGAAAIAPGAITSIAHDEDAWMLSLNGEQYTLTDGDMADLERTIRERGQSGKTIQKEAMKNQMLLQAEVARDPEVRAAQKEQVKENMRIQAEAVFEIEQGVQPGKIVGVGGRKRFGQ